MSVSDQRLGRLLFLLAMAMRGSVALAAEPTSVDYNFDIKPILSDRCFLCHGPDGNQRKANLRLDRADGMGKARGGRAVIVAGDPTQSELYRRITTHDPSEIMPRPEAKLPPVTEDEIVLIRRWIEDGAQWKEHWSFLPLGDPIVPKSEGSVWPRGPIDQFVLAKLPQGAGPSSEASKEKLLRRVTFDLTGLPPTPAEIDAFLCDTSPRAYENVVDCLLKSDRFGERMAVPWLDLARYADTYGYQVDRSRPVWPWRDWVIRAINENLPYDQFITWQLAGDLLPGASDEQILATAFNRLHPQKVEGGSTEEEFRVEYVADRTHTFATAMLGLTLQCARCHDHKYDPILQQEYYQLYAFFNSIDESGLYAYFNNGMPTPTLLLRSEEEKAKVAAIEGRIDELEQQLEAARRSRRGALLEPIPTRLPALESPGRGRRSAELWDRFLAWHPGRDREPNLPGELAHHSFDAAKDGKFENLVNADAPASSGPANRVVPGKSGGAIQLTGDDAVRTKVGNFTRNHPFSVALWINTPDVKQRAVVFHRSRAWTDAASRGYQLLIEDGALSASLIHFWPGNAIRVRTRAQIPTKTWVHVTICYDGSSHAAGLKIYVDGREAACETVRDNLYKNITGGGGDNIAIGERFRDRGFTNGLVDEFRVFDRQLSMLEVAQLYDGHSLQAVLNRSIENLSLPERDFLYDYYLANFDPTYRRLLTKIEDLRGQRNKAIDAQREIMVMRELSSPRETFLLRRGAYDAPTERVLPGTPAAMLAFPSDQPRNRLGLAHWLTHPRHPLTARVAVNRFWQICFGHGLVRTPEDFGSQGELPTHPTLLDWLAKDFMESGWNVKRLMKQMVMSATYRQSSVAGRELLAKDPLNRWLARGPSYRLPAEMIRDNLLAVSELLVEKIGGEPVKPYELSRSFKPSTPDKGEGLYRRSVYTFWQRTGPAPVMMALDASKRDDCVVQRERTSTPLQALVLMNDPQVVEAARILAQRMIQKHGDQRDALFGEIFLRLTSRRPDSRERAVLEALYQEQLEHFTAKANLATEFLTTGEAPRDKKLPAPELAATSVLVKALMNYDECVVKR